MGQCTHVDEDGERCSNKSPCRVPKRQFCQRHAPEGSVTLYAILQMVGLELVQLKEAEKHPSPWPTIMGGAADPSAACIMTCPAHFQPSSLARVAVSW